MSFRNMVANDIGVFINTREFAETHSINLKSVECVVDDSESDNVLKYHDGTKTVSQQIYVKSSDIDSSVGAGDYIEFDGSLYVISGISEYDGIKVVKLDKPVGKFNMELTIQSPVNCKVSGIYKQTWEDFYSCKAYVRNMNANDMMKLGTIKNTQTIFVKMPYCSGINSKMRVVFNGKPYSITSADNIEYGNKFIDLICEAVI